MIAFSVSFSLNWESENEMSRPNPEDEERRVLNDVLTRLTRIEQSLKHQHDMLHFLTEQGTQIMATQTEMAAALNKVNDQLVKVGGETTQLLKDIDDLKVLIANAPVTPELQAAFDKVAAQAKVVDDLVPDAAPPAPPAP